MTGKNSELIKTESWDIEKVIPYENNAKIHDAEQINKLANIIDEFGFIQPIIVDENGVILAGHGRRLAAIQLKLKKVPIIVVRDLTEKQKGFYRIADNKVSSGNYDETLLGNEIKDLLRASEHELLILDVELLGMNSSELDSIFEKFSIDEISGMLSDDSSKITSDEISSDAKPKSEVKEVEYEKSYTVSIDCSGEDEQLELYKQLTAEGRNCRIMTM